MKLQRFYSWDKRESSGFGSFGTTAHPAWWDEIRDRDPPQNETQFLAEWSNSPPPTAHFDNAVLRENISRLATTEDSRRTWGESAAGQASVTWPYRNRWFFIQEALSKTQLIRDRVDRFGHYPIGFQLER